MLWHSEVIGDFVKTIFSLVQEGGHFLAIPSLASKYKLTAALFQVQAYC